MKLIMFEALFHRVQISAQYLKKNKMVKKKRVKKRTIKKKKIKKKVKKHSRGLSKKDNSLKVKKLIKLAKSKKKKNIKI